LPGAFLGIRSGTLLGEMDDSIRLLLLKELRRGGRGGKRGRNGLL